MVSFKYTITDEVGIHARPAGILVKEAKKYPATITLKTAKGSADARKLMAIMALGVKQNDEVTVEVEGENEEQAAKEIQAFFEANL
ncbi:phosphocarrier protein PtsH [Clostridium sp. CAG:632]|jgi:phosphocarrier protein HPr|nr:HPr family phosphocarrier protein [Clostridium sp.]MDD6267268.1 HPr family phosphocarrier protein [Clostridium sp.]CCY57651.1 phosphocarrier protein PtsH [Clostridium sp. CAG:632]